MNAAKIAEVVPTVVFEHHILRSQDWESEARVVFEAGHNAKNRVVTAAGYVNQPTLVLEAHRQELYEKEEPSPEFIKWTKLQREKRARMSPPI
jgi:predicted metallo-beta-lactamase superfamily hydrolase